MVPSVLEEVPKFDGDGIHPVVSRVKSHLCACTLVSSQTLPPPTIHLLCRIERAQGVKGEEHRCRRTVVEGALKQGIPGGNGVVVGRGWGGGAGWGRAAGALGAV